MWLKLPGVPTSVPSGRQSLRKPSRLLALFAITLLGACAGCKRKLNLAKPPAVMPSACPTFHQAESVGRVQDRQLNEISGVVASRLHPGFLYVHNDSGDSARVFMLNAQGEVHATLNLPDTPAFDWEDIAIATGADGKPLVVAADVGDNFKLRSALQFHAFAEPPLPAKGATIDVTGLQTHTFVFEDKARDVEGVAIHPTNGNIYLFTKQRNANDGGVYAGRWPLHPPGPKTGPNIFKRVAALPGALMRVRSGGLVTAADISPAGDMILLRTYDHAFVWNWPPGATISSVLAQGACYAPLAPEPQGEAIGFAADGAGYFTLSEEENQPLYLYKRIK